MYWLLVPNLLSHSNLLVGYHVNVVHVAEVNVVVQVGEGLRLGSGVDVAATVGVGGDLEDLVIGVLLVGSQSSGPNVVRRLLFLELVGARRRSGVLVVLDEVVDSRINLVARLLQGSMDLAVSMEHRESREARLGGEGRGNESCELHNYYNILIL